MDQKPRPAVSCRVLQLHYSGANGRHENLWKIPSAHIGVQRRKSGKCRAGTTPTSASRLPIKKTHAGYCIQRTGRRAYYHWPSFYRSHYSRWNQQRRRNPAAHPSIPLGYGWSTFLPPTQHRIRRLSMRSGIRDQPGYQVCRLSTPTPAPLPQTRCKRSLCSTIRRYP